MSDLSTFPDLRDTVVKWRRNGDFLEGLVPVDDGVSVTRRWMPALRLTPVSETPSGISPEK